MTRRILAGVLATLMAANAAAMLFAGRWWYGVVPGVTSTGPFNPHFVMDVGAAYLMVAGAMAWRAARPASGQGALVAAAAFLVLHGLIHLAGAAMDGHAAADLARDFPGVYLPAILAVWLAWPTRRPI